MKYDIAVIGGGPAGMMSAGRAGQMGARVVLLEKNTQFGIKLLMTGKGRCNLTNQNSNLREAINQFGENGKFLFSAFNRFGINDTIAFFNQAGLKTKIERGNRVFPVSDKSADVLATLINYLKKSKVKIKTKATVKKIIRQNNKITKIVLMNNEEVVADQYIICTG
ncbi:MAG: NAD(P)/FAD-dependent oxidoreductase, partial [Candidatus Aenigmarchaeota archaeon]|nr:NAD(P)/FAD-dependent oxidoreductase [Candidatus Aenigmarchaeota archaeon]